MHPRSQRDSVATHPASHGSAIGDRPIESASEVSGWLALPVRGAWQGEVRTSLRGDGGNGEAYQRDCIEHAIACHGASLGTGEAACARALLRCAGALCLGGRDELDEEGACTRSAERRRPRAIATAGSSST